MTSQSSTSVLRDPASNEIPSDHVADLPFATHQREEFLAIKLQLEALSKEIKTLNQAS